MAMSAEHRSNLQPFTGNGLHMSENFSSGTINPKKQTNIIRNSEFWCNELICFNEL